MHPEIRRKEWPDPVNGCDSGNQWIPLTQDMARNPRICITSRRQSTPARNPYTRRDQKYDGPFLLKPIGAIPSQFPFKLTDLELKYAAKIPLVL